MCEKAMKIEVDVLQVDLCNMEDNQQKQGIKQQQIKVEVSCIFTKQMNFQYVRKFIIPYNSNILTNNWISIQLQCSQLRLLQNYNQLLGLRLPYNSKVDLQIILLNIENSMKKAFVLLLLFSALNITINCHEDCQNADYNNCRQIQCKGMYWSNSQGRCRQCSDHNQICRSCPDYYDDTTNSCKNTTNTSDSNSNKPNNGQNNSQSCQAISKSSCTTQPCERYFLNPSTNSCQKCSLASLSQCSMCEHHYFSTANICTMCTYNITNCTGCDSDSNAQCLHGCPHNYHLNSTSCVPEQVVQVNLVLNPSRLIPDWDNLTTNQKNSQAANSTEVKQAIYKLIGMENQTFRVQIKNIRAGSLNVDLIVYPSSLESPSSTSQKVSSAIATNEQASGFTVLSNSVAVTKINNADTSSSGISTVMIVCIAVGSVIGLTAIFIIVKCIKSRLAAQQESAQTISEKYMNSAEGAIKNPHAEKDEFELAAAASINTADS